MKPLSPSSARFSVLAFFSILLIFSSPVLSSPAVGTVSGKYSTQNGIASYVIPILAPPGVAGVKPQVSLEYNSQRGNGVAGLGWSIGGLSSISRCPRTIVQDGESQGITLTGEDRYCLDGQRLVAVKGQYGSVGAEYRTEIETFSKVESVGGDAGNPWLFWVKSKDGDKKSYSRSGIYNFPSWLVSTIEDRFGNKIVYRYSSDSGSEKQLSEIIYANNKIIFSYRGRSDESQGYLAGRIIKSTKLLDEVSVLSSGELVRRYSLRYSRANQFEPSRLLDITECNGAGECFPPTTFSWTPDKILQLEGYWSSSLDNYSGSMMSKLGGSDRAYNAAAGDYNGDGRGDLAFYNGYGNQWRVCYSEGDRFDCEVMPIHGVPRRNVIVGDFDGDGKDDMAAFTGGGATWVVCYAERGGFECRERQALGTYSENVVPADFDSDGIMDIAAYTGSNGVWHMCYGETDGFDCRYVKSHGGGAANNALGDFNGDGRADLAGHAGGGTWDICYASARGEDFSCSYQSAHGGGTGNNVSADFNGDGLTDLAGYTHSGNTWHVCLSKGGTGFECRMQQIHGGGVGNNQTADFNSDGRVDMGAFTGSGDRWHVCLGKGDGSFACEYKSIYSVYPQDVLGTDLNGDGITDFAATVGGNSWHVKTPFEGARQYLAGIDNGETSVQIDYERMGRDAELYVTSGIARYPEQEVIAPMTLVKSVNVDNGIGGQNKTTYRYGSMKTNLKGRGSLGFSWIEEFDLSTRRIVRTEYKQSFPYIGSPERVEECLVDGPENGYTSDSQRCSNGSHQLINLARNYYARRLIRHSSGAESYYPYIHTSEQRSYELNNQLVKKVTILNSNVDPYGNVGHVKVVTTGEGGIFTKETTNTFESADEYRWVIGRLSHSSVRHTAPGQSDVTREATFSYNWEGALERETVHPGTALEKTSEYSYDQYGNRIETKVSGSNQLRISKSEYQSDGRFPTKVINALGHVETRVYDQKTGELLSRSDPNGLTTHWYYDGWGRKISEVRADGNSIAWEYKWAGDCDYTPALATRCMSEKLSGSGESVAFTDSVGRKIRSIKQSFDGAPVFLDTIYDSTGRVVQLSRPYGLNDLPIWANTSYDELGRSVSVVQPWTLGRTVEAKTVYNGGVTLHIDALGRRKTITKNAMDQVVRVVDNYQASASYIYDAAGNLVATTHPDGSLSTAKYDVSGNKTGMIDPNMGEWSYTYNAFGELISQSDGKGQASQFLYDSLGRLIQRTETEGVTIWHYDGKHSLCPQSSYTGRGKVWKISGVDGFEQINCHDAYGRVSKKIILVEGERFSTTHTFDEFGRLDTVTYPDGDFVVKNVYNEFGYLAEVQRLVPGTTTETVWEAMSRDNEGRLTEIHLGNGLRSNFSYDSRSGQLLKSYTGTISGSLDIRDIAYEINEVNNVVRRTDQLNNIDEHFSYDGLDRLTRSKVVSSGQTHSDYNRDLLYRYDNSGNITYKSDVGNYSYSENSPNQVIKIGATHLSYDANGSMTQSGDLSLEWSSFNKPVAITRHRYTDLVWNNTWGGFSNASGVLGPLALTENILPEIWRVVAGQETQLRLSRVEFAYGPDRARYKKISRTSSGDIVTWYSGKHYERIDDAVTAKKIEKFYIYAGDSLVAVHSSDGQHETTRYLHTDALGSVDATTDEVGRVVDSSSYNPFGSKRASIGPADPSTTRGFGGHEHIGEFGGLIHMNGRIYNALAGRFISADPNIQSPYNTQNLNRYSYVLNNPLKYSDPSGFFFKKLFKGIAKALSKIEGLGVVIQVVGAMYLGPYFLAAWNAVLTYGATGSLSAGLKAGLISGAAAWLGGQLGAGTDIGSWENILGNGLIGGVVSDATGGDFGRGFLSSAFAASAKAGIMNKLGRDTDFASTFKRTLAAATIGGTSSRITGGKFANGAATAAFSHLVNSETTLRSSSSEVKSDVDSQKGAGWFRPDEHKYVVGRDGHPIVWSGEQGPGIGSFIDDHIPAGHTFGTNHDAFVELMVDQLGVPDVLVNIPSMAPIYMFSVGQELVNTPFRVMDKYFDTDVIPFEHSH